MAFEAVDKNIMGNFIKTGRQLRWTVNFNVRHFHIRETKVLFFNKILASSPILYYWVFMTKAEVPNLETQNNGLRANINNNY